MFQYSQKYLLRLHYTITHGPKHKATLQLEDDKAKWKDKSWPGACITFLISGKRAQMRCTHSVFSGLDRKPAITEKPRFYPNKKQDSLQFHSSTPHWKSNVLVGKEKRLQAKILWSVSYLWLNSWETQKKLMDIKYTIVRNGQNLLRSVIIHGCP